VLIPQGARSSEQAYRVACNEWSILTAGISNTSPVRSPALLATISVEAVSAYTSDPFEPGFSFAGAATAHVPALDPGATHEHALAVLFHAGGVYAVTVRVGGADHSVTVHALAS
jgi:hypothetical protein